MQSKKIKNQKETFSASFLFKCALIVTVTLLFPMISGLCLVLISSVSKNTKLALIGSMVIVMGLFYMNLNKEIISDLYWYSRHYLYNLNDPLDVVFSSYRAGVQARIEEPFYHLLMYYVARLTNADYTAFVFVVTVLTYVLTIISVTRILHASNYPGRNFAFVLVFLLFCSIVFTQSLHLIRQYISCSIFLFGLSYYVNKRYLIAFILFATSILTHNSVVVVLVLLLGIHLIQNFSNNRYILFHFISLIYSLLIGVLFLASFHLFGSAERLNIDDGSVSLSVKLVDASLFFFSVYFYKFNKHRINRKFKIIIYFYFYFFVLLTVLHASYFLSLRYYFYLDFLRWIPLAMFFYVYRFKLLQCYISLIFLIISSLFYFQARLNSSPFEYGGSLYDYFIYPASEIMKDN